MYSEILCLKKIVKSRAYYVSTSRIYSSPILTYALTYLLQAQTNDAANGDVDSNKGILVDLLNLLGQTSKDATLKSLIFINQIEDELNEGEELGSNTKNFFVLLKEYLHASLDQHNR